MTSPPSDQYPAGPLPFEGRPGTPPAGRTVPRSGGGGGRVGIIVAVVAVVALVLCTGGAAVAVLVASRLDRAGDDPGATIVSGSPSVTGSPSAAGPAGSVGSAAGRPAVDCRFEAKPGKVVGPPGPDVLARTDQTTMTLATNLGQVVIDLNRVRAPCTVASFTHLAAKRFFDGTGCHRLVTEGISVLQCGDPVGDGTGRPDYQFADESLAGTGYDRGVVAMANAGPGTNGSQFFIVYASSPLPPQYTVFGTVRSGLEIVDRVAAGGHDNSFGSAGGGRPKTPVTLTTVSVT